MGKRFEFYRRTLIALRVLVLASAISVIVYMFVFTPHRIDGQSMAPTLNHGDLVLADRLIQWLNGSPLQQFLQYYYNRGDVVLFQQQGQGILVKRIIGLPGDTVSLQDGSIYINGIRLQENYILPSVRNLPGDFLQNGDTKIVPTGSYFVMGDNRENSKDSRYETLKFVSREQLRGRLILRYWPVINSMGNDIN